MKNLASDIRHPFFLIEIRTRIVVNSGWFFPGEIADRNEHFRVSGSTLIWESIIDIPLEAPERIPFPERSPKC